MDNRTALVIGISGQDGYFLTKTLLENSYKVLGFTRSLNKAKKIFVDPKFEKINFFEWDLKNQVFLEEVLTKYQVDEIYNLAAFTSGSSMFDNPIDMIDINGVAVLRILESIRKVNVKIRFCQASSSEVFGHAKESPQDEKTIRNPRSPYATAKIYADTMVKLYRDQYKIFGCSAILYNHESPLRKMEFVTRKVTNAVARIKLGLDSKILLGNLDSKRDWGYAPDFSMAMYLMLQSSVADDYVISTGILHSVKDLCECAFSYVDLDYKDFLSEDSTYYRPSESIHLVGNSTKAMQNLHWKPSINFTKMIHIMVDNDLRLLIDGNI